MTERFPEFMDDVTPEEEGIPEVEDRLPDRETALPRDHPLGLEEHGTTEAEQRAGEDLAGRLEREEPEAEPAASRDEAAGRMVEDASETGEPDRTKELLGSEHPGDREGLSAEEDAVRVRPEE